MNLDVLNTRVIHHLATGRAQEAADLLRDHLEEHQDSAEFWLLYSGSQLSLEHWKDAEEAARRSLTLTNANPIAAEHLAFSLLKQQRRSEALAVINWVIELAPEYARGHYWLSAILLSNLENNDERILARQAIEHALHLDPDEPDFYLCAAMVAEVQDDNQGALAFLQSGLYIAPQHQGLLRAARHVDNSQSLVGDHSQLLMGLLANDPMNEGLHEDLAQSFVAKQTVYADRFWLFIPLLAVLASLGSGANLNGPLLAIPAILIATGLFTAWCYQTYRGSAKHLPAGYRKEIDARYSLLPKAFWAYRISLGLSLGGAIVGCFLPVAGASVMLLAIVLSQLAVAGINREASDPPTDRTDRREVKHYLLRLTGAYASGFWKRMLFLLIQVGFFGICMAGERELAAVPLGSIGVGMLLTGWMLAICSIRLGFKDNAFALGLSMNAPAKRRNLARFRGIIGGIYAIMIYLIISNAAIVGAGVLLLSDSVDYEPKPVVRQKTWEEKAVEDTLRRPQPEYQQFKIEPLPELPDIPPLEMPNK